MLLNAVTDGLTKQNLDFRLAVAGSYNHYRSLGYSQTVALVGVD